MRLPRLDDCACRHTGGEHDVYNRCMVCDCHLFATRFQYGSLARDLMEWVEATIVLAGKLRTRARRAA